MADGEARERRVVVAVDESDQSMYALSWCLENLISDVEGGNTKDTLILLYARPPRAVYTALDGTASAGYLFSTEVVESMEKYSLEMAASVIDKATAICRGLKNDVKVETGVGRGDARDVICDLVDKVGGDILVMGSHGYGIIKRSVLGSVSNHCAQNVKCPVLIVKKPKA